MNTLLWEVLKDVTRWGQTQKPARTDEGCCCIGTERQGCRGGLNARSPLTSSMSDLLTQSPWVLGCRCLVRWCRWSGRGVKCDTVSFSRPVVADYQYSCRHWLNAAHWCKWAERALATKGPILVSVSRATVFVNAVSRQYSKCWSGNVTERMTATMLTQHFTHCLKTVTIVHQNVCRMWENWLSLRKPKL